MESLKVALLQLKPAGTLEGNLKKGADACRKAAAMGADIALFPEMWSNGYGIPSKWGPPVPENWKDEAVPADGDYGKTFAALAKELNMAIAVTLFEKFDPAPRNTMLLFDRHGERVLTYAKVHTCDFDMEHELTPGEDFYVTELDTASGPVNVGAMICFDREFPESARILMLKGAELILVPNACPMELNRLTQLRARAFENMLGIATCNYPEGHPDCNGHSTAFDGIAYKEGVPGSCDTLILEADGSEGIYLADFPMDEIRDYRSREVHGNAYRRPSCYSILLDKKQNEPFVREDRRP
ncbi:MAG: carbon-nitrogen hydrolase family protein [Oscillospiraceae bacterium]|nr:carbon-nitrogen hydrolase family protein [Oscillospiraceae bacterium]